MNKGKKSKVGILILVAFFVYFAITLVQQQSMLSGKEGLYNAMQTRISDESKVKADLEKQKDNLNSDENIEKIAREKLGMVKKGERVFVDVSR